MHRIQAAVVLLSVLLLASCSPKYTRFVSNYNFTSPNLQPDYSNLNYWAAHPWKHDPADSVPQPLQKNYMPD
ncbi:MAG TPA: hypothetical protein VEB42_09825, partial [Chitinophagaceae bacterium]|nr:hypothetical protein [Chitinophagaceae bacterium]